MSTALFYLSNAVMVYAFAVALGACLWRRTDLQYVFLNLFRQRRRSGMTLLAIVLGGVAVFLFGGFVDYSFWALREQTIRTNVGHIQLYEKGYLESGAAVGTMTHSIANYDEIARILRTDPVIGPHIKTVTGRIEFSGIISRYESGVSTFFSGVGVEPETSLELGALDRVVSGSDLSRIQSKGVTIGSGVAAALKAKYDDYTDMLVVTPGGGQNAMSVQVRGVFSSGIKEYDDTTIKLPLKTVQQLLQTSNVSRMIILLDNTDYTDAAMRRIDEIIKARNLPLEARPWTDLAVFYHQVVNLFEGIFFFIKALVSVIVVFMIGNTLMMSVVERTREIATLRALGLTKRHVGRLFILEGIVIGLLGAAISVVLGIGIAELININGVPMPPSPGYTQGYLAFVMWTGDYRLFWFACALPLVTAVIASIMPARRAANLVIAEAFRFV
ncbi:ABC transporter permease [Paraburkholderia silviterrae]|uniref:ABC transporter permease n=1 Tax=Paraburkholderia silviterrae TaxID=2528715 RepID=A0A4R5LYF4_9BURK|nr:FtsX-like permease family protein [Paraburkholderia silviterrae]TDG17127.1 ABC transporter permease [Paraburkholderia silviterrae]